MTTTGDEQRAQSIKTLAPIIAPNEDCDAEDLSNHARSILSKLHYSTVKCKSCHWFVHEDEVNWYCCEYCDAYLCDDCGSHDTNTTFLLCHECGKKYKSVEN